MNQEHQQERKIIDPSGAQIGKFSDVEGSAGSTSNVREPTSLVVRSDFLGLSSALDRNSEHLVAVPGARPIVRGAYENPLFSPGAINGVSPRPIRAELIDERSIVLATENQGLRVNGASFLADHCFGSLVLRDHAGSLMRHDLWLEPEVGAKRFSFTEDGRLNDTKGEFQGLRIVGAFHADLNRIDRTGWIAYCDQAKPVDSLIPLVELGSPLRFTEEILRMPGYTVAPSDLVDPKTQRPTPEALRKYGLEEAPQNPGTFARKNSFGNIWNYRVDQQGLHAFAARSETDPTPVFYELRNGIFVPETALGRGSGYKLNQLIFSSDAQRLSLLDPQREHFATGAIIFKRTEDGRLQPFDRFSVSNAITVGKKGACIDGDHIKLQLKDGTELRAEITFISLKGLDGIDDIGCDVYGVIGEPRLTAKIPVGHFGDIGLGIFAAAREALTPRH